ncbi:hypothetical protein Cgig2_027725 [Carnegiea gigantea]|uniref:Uncharacterized protein n=1 Tax=Carnegiea gigantea TaxID=171969 RepID=A0A9Q1JW77_9CARY|nr:hypothetical protein Cgig2_027725 [Carnegiea gigantea]
MADAIHVPHTPAPPVARDLMHVSFGIDLRDTKIPIEVWRYYLLTNSPEVLDTTFSWTGQGYGSTIPNDLGAESHSSSRTLAEKVRDLVEQYVKAMEKVLKQLNMPQIQASLFDKNGDIEKLKKLWEILPAAHKIGKPKPLFKELKDDEREFIDRNLLAVKLTEL